MVLSINMSEKTTRDLAERHFAAALDRFAAGDLERAVAEYNKSIHADPTFSDPLHGLARVYLEPPYHEVDAPPGSEPLVLVAPSTAQDPEHRLLRAALIGLAREPIRVLATWNRRPLRGPVPVAANSRLVEWVSYSRTMPACALVICHAGHGTMVLVRSAYVGLCAMLAILLSRKYRDRCARARR